MTTGFRPRRVCLVSGPVRVQTVDACLETEPAPPPTGRVHNEVASPQVKLSGYAIGDAVHEIEDSVCHLGERRAAAPIGLAPWLAARLPWEWRFGIGADGGRRFARRRHE